MRAETKRRCKHTEMIERPNDPDFAWECADCGHVFGHDNPREKGDDDGVEYADPRDEIEDRL